jgi:hypothetical protein
MSLSICLVTRYAEDRLERVLRSVAPLGAEILVADTGSRDGTVATAQALGASAFVVPWKDDFAAAQNLALERATGDWVLWLNPDEELLPESLRQVPALLARPEALAYAVRIQEVTQPDQTGPAVESWAPRLFRRLPEIRYVGRLHPHFDPPLDQVARQRNQQICRTDLLIRHHAYLSVLTQDKLRWATRLLELELADRPGQLHYLIEYGRNLLRLNDPKGHVILAQASDLVAAAAATPLAPSPTVASLFEYLLTVAPEQSRSSIGREQAAQLARRWFAGSPPLLWLLAQQAFQAGQFQQAAGLLEKLVHLGRTRTYDHSAPFDPSLMGDPALLNLGKCFLALNDLVRAQECFTQVLPNPKLQGEARRGLAQVEGRRQGT